MVKRHRRAMGRRAAQAAAWADECRLGAGATAADRLDQEVGARRALGALSQLSPKKRELLLMMAIENETGEDVAGTLGIPIGTMWSRLRHARRELRHLFDDDAA
jgi:RNA polymerase sigma-70 factor (ECF subfamily)